DGMLVTTHFDAAVRHPQMAQKSRDGPRRLLEHDVRDAFFPRTETESTHPVEPRGNGVALPVRQPLCRRQVHLIPATSLLDARLDAGAEDRNGEFCDRLCQVRLARGVLDGVPR